MNIVAPIPNAIVYPTANVNTEAARRDNQLKDAIPPSTDAQQGDSGKGLGSEADKARSPGQLPAPVTYEKPQTHNSVAQDLNHSFNSASHDNAEKESAGKQDAQERQRQQQELEQLKERDQEVRTHEQTHAAAGGQYAGSPQYEYETGPDGRRYVVDGEVAIDVAQEATPKQTLQKMEQVRAAALAPAEPSEADLKVANEAAQKASAARTELADEASSPAPASQNSLGNGYVSPPVNEEQALRIGVIQQHYQSASVPRAAGFSVSA